MPQVECEGDKLYREARLQGATHGRAWHEYKKRVRFQKSLWIQRYRRMREKVARDEEWEQTHRESYYDRENLVDPYNAGIIADEESFSPSDLVRDEPPRTQSNPLSVGDTNLFGARNAEVTAKQRRESYQSQAAGSSERPPSPCTPPGPVDAEIEPCSPELCRHYLKGYCRYGRRC